jgi:LysM repeat protein
MSALAVHSRAGRLGARPQRVARARLRVVLVVALVLATAAVVVSGTVARASGSGTVGPRTITVQRGDTLSHIALRELPALPVGTAVAEIQLANKLNTTHVHAGQRLVIPPAG